MLQSSPSQANRARHLPFLDGIRGFAALWVVFHHAFMEYLATNAIPRGMSWMENGELAVIVFIVLSGYCLMLPAVRAGGELRGGLIRFFRRRAWRILPAYYVAMLISLLLTALVPALRHPVSEMRWAFTQPVTKIGVLAHLLLVQHFKNVWMLQIDYPMWSISVEWWLYLGFALVLLPVYRKFGVTAMLLCACMFGFGVTALIPTRYQYLHVHFLALFGFGSAAAAAGWGCCAEQVDKARRALATTSALFGFIYLARMAATAPEEWNTVLMAALLGICVTAFLAYGAVLARTSSGSRSPLVLLVESSLAIWLGDLSYSLYLIHAPFLALIHAGLLAASLTGTRALVLEVFLGVPLSLLCAWALNRLVERPAHQRARRA